MRKSLFLVWGGICLFLFSFAGTVDAENYKKVIVWDVDGVIIDSAKETYIVSLETIKRHENDIKNAFGTTVREYSYNEFYRDRPFVKKAHEFFLHAFSRHFMSKNADQLSDNERKDIYTKYKLLIDKMTDTFYLVRKEFQNNNINVWYDLNPVYPGIPEAMKQLKDSGFEFVVMSSKDKASIWSLFKHHGIHKYFEENMIFDVTTGRNRKEQMEKIQKIMRHNNEYVIVDDIPEQLAVNKENMESKNVQYIGAKWGYGKGWNKYQYIKVVENPSMLLEVIIGAKK